MKRYFITGTDTDCGKTYVTRELLCAVPNSVAIKPIATGCINRQGELISLDAVEILTDSAFSVKDINPWRFKLPVSPHIAAASEGKSISMDEVIDYCMHFQGSYDHLFIEGAGGLLVPLNAKETWIDFLKCTSIPVILVVGLKLGCINHALLTSLALQSQGIECIGWIANCTNPNILAVDAVIDTLRTKLPFPLLSRLDYKGKLKNIFLTS